jgi:PleD family two-component response regulator
MAAARAAEYTKVADEAMAAGLRDEITRQALSRRLRAELRRIQRRDYFPPVERDRAAAAVDALTAPRATSPDHQS